MQRKKISAKDFALIVENSEYIISLEVESDTSKNRVMRLKKTLGKLLMLFLKISSFEYFFWILFLNRILFLKIAFQMNAKYLAKFSFCQDLKRTRNTNRCVDIDETNVARYCALFLYISAFFNHLFYWIVFGIEKFNISAGKWKKIAKISTFIVFQVTILSMWLFAFCAKTLFSCV